MFAAPPKPKGTGLGQSLGDVRGVAKGEEPFSSDFTSVQGLDDQHRSSTCITSMIIDYFLSLISVLKIDTRQGRPNLNEASEKEVKPRSIRLHFDIYMPAERRLVNGLRLRL